jgi:hypothetical protein
MVTQTRVNVSFKRTLPRLLSTLESKRCLCPGVKFMFGMPSLQSFQTAHYEKIFLKSTILYYLFLLHNALSLNAYGLLMWYLPFLPHCFCRCYHWLALRHSAATNADHQCDTVPSLITPQGFPMFLLERRGGSTCRCNVLIGNVYWVGLQEGFAFLLCNEHCVFIQGLSTCNNIPRPNISSRTAPKFRIPLLSWQFHYWFGAAIQDWKW